MPQVGSYVASGEVDAGFVNKTEALAIADRAGPALEMPQCVLRAKSRCHSAR
ncbi:MAG: hypothetical protein QM702_20685 [Rubrivivax sp.]